MAVVALFKNAVAVTGASMAVIAGQTKKVTLTDDERRYVKGSDKFTFKVDGGDASPEWVPPKGRWVQEFRCTADADGEHITVTISVA